jgi:hypothetical protein
MWQALLALVGVVLGGAIAGGVTLRQLRLITDREHEARQAERELARQDGRRVFQRDTILAIQDGVADLLRIVVYLYDEAVNAEEKTGHWPAPGRFDELPASFDEHFACVQGLRARVFDEELRRLVAELATFTLKAVHAGDRESAARLMVVLKDINKQVQERIHGLLKELFQTRRGSGAAAFLADLWSALPTAAISACLRGASTHRIPTRRLALL